MLIEEVVDSGRLQSCYIGVSLNFQLLGKRPSQLDETTWNNSRREIFSASSRLEKYKKTKKENGRLNLLCLEHVNMHPGCFPLMWMTEIL